MSSSDKVLIIAEAGVNHNGSISTAKKLIDVACEAGVDFVKFQTFKADKLVTKSAAQAEYQKKNLGIETGSQFEMLKKLELSHDDHLELIDYCSSRNIHFFSTAFDVSGLEYLDSLGFSMFKVPSGELTNYPYLKKLAEFGKPVILSTGMANLVEIEEAINVLISDKLKKDDITVLHCNTEYPTPYSDVNLKAMKSIHEHFHVDVGYSDHTLGIEVPIAAVALGATVIEKHFTLDRNLPGPDHRASLEPKELSEMVKAIRNISKAIEGDGIKRPSSSELKNIGIARKSIHVIRDLKMGTELKDHHLVALRPGNGISPMEWQNVIGKKLTRDVACHEKLSPSDIE